MSDVPFKLIGKYEGAPLYLVREHHEKSCDGCCFDSDRQRMSLCNHALTLECGTNKTICVRSLNEYTTAAVTLKLTGELP